MTGLQIAIRTAPDPDASAIGWLRIGAVVHLKQEATKTPTCASGWHPIHPAGFVCLGLGITSAATEADPSADAGHLANAAPTSDAGVPTTPDPSLPYVYWFVKDHLVPEYHRLPSRDEQRAALAFRKRYFEIFEKNEKRARRFLRGELTRDMAKPAVVHRYLDRGFYVAGVGVETRAFRSFVRTARNRYIKQAQMHRVSPPPFRGVEVSDERPLPIAWAVRAAQPLIRREKDDGTVRFVRDLEAEPIARHSIVTTWKTRRNVAGTVVHELEGDRYVKDWFFAVAERTEKPRGIGKQEPWVHVRLRDQTLVLYRGSEPVFATLVSSGLPEHSTPTGLFEVRRKYVADTMANVGDTKDDRYSIEDVTLGAVFQRLACDSRRILAQPLWPSAVTWVPESLPSGR